MNIKEKQDELKRWIRKIGMTQKCFSGHYCYYEYNDLSEEDIKQFYEKFKGHLKRDTTPVETIDMYLKYLYELGEFKDKCYIKPLKIKDDIFGEEFDKTMEQISRSITKTLDKKNV